jgi:hypothetical protein
MAYGCVREGQKSVIKVIRTAIAMVQKGPPEMPESMKQQQAQETKTP